MNDYGIVGTYPTYIIYQFMFCNWKTFKKINICKIKNITYNLNNIVELS